MKLTAANVAKLALPPGKADHIEPDDDVPGFGFRLRGGSKTWTFQYRIGRRQRRLTIGSATAIKAADARATAEKLYAKAKLGQDPAGEKDKAIAAEAETFAAALKPYLERLRRRLRPRSDVEITRHLEVHAKPLHRLSLAAIGRRDIARLIAQLSATSGPVAANRTVASVSAFLAYCMRDGLIDANVAAFVNKIPEAARVRVLSDDELGKVWKAAAGRGDRYGAIVKLLVLTGARREEIGALLWSEIDLGRATIALPASRTKNNRPHEIPLSAPALAILEAQPRREGRDYVFGTRHGFNGWAAGKASLDRRAEIAPWVIHDLRRTISTVMHDRLGVMPHIVEAVLGRAGHRSGLAGVYNRAGYTTEKRRALDLWAEHVLAIVEGRESKIVALRA